jgi:hypothetical protein
MPQLIKYITPTKIFIVTSNEFLSQIPRSVFVRTTINPLRSYLIFTTYNIIINNFLKEKKTLKNFYSKTYRVLPYNVESDLFS